MVVNHGGVVVMRRPGCHCGHCHSCLCVRRHGHRRGRRVVVAVEKIVMVVVAVSLQELNSSII